ncbi:lysine histidine transporter 2-like [Aristolochia californica]|uniref:lysine histidine transporter 2-like n=1 Tax=Aristolochia californica TaxID=171875 RepID=UPI0035DFAA30
MTTIEEKEKKNAERKTTEKDLDNWLPVTASRKAKWWYSTFHNVTAVVGAGVLGLPFAFSQLGWAGGITALAISWIITLYSFWQLVVMHEMVPGRRFDRYHELGQHVFGEKLGLWIVVPQQVGVQMATNIVYMVTGGKSLKKFFDIVAPTFGAIRKTYFIMIFAAIHLVISQCPNFNSIRSISLVAASMSVCYSAVAFIASLMKGQHPGISHGVRSSTPAGITFDVLNAIGTVGFAYAGHSVALEIQATIPSTEEKSSKKPMWRGVMVAYVVVALCYFGVSIAGFWAFGDIVQDDILVSLERPPWLIAIGNLMVFIHVIGSYQVFAMPIFDMIEYFLVKKLKFSPGHPLRLSARSSYVLLTALIAICIPFFGGLLGFFGGLVFAPTSYFIPCVMWLIAYKPKVLSFHWTMSWLSIIIGSLLMILSPIGGLRQIILDAKTYKFFS